MEEICKVSYRVNECLPIVWTLQDTASPVVQDDTTSHLATIYGVGARGAHPAGAPWGEAWCLIGSWDVEGGGG